MSFRLNFITNDELIRSQLSQSSQSIKESTNSRHDVSRFIGQDFCRNLHNLVENLKEHMMKEENTIIFVNGGSKVFGLIVFRIIQRPTEAIMVEYICVPETGQKGIGTQLLNKVKEVAKNMNLSIYLFPIDESIEFYIKNGFERRKGGFYVFTPSTSGGKRKRTIRKSRKPIKAKTRTHIHK